MSIWYVNEIKPITVITDAHSPFLQAYYVDNTTANSYVLIEGTFTKSEDRYILNHSFNSVGSYIIKVIDLEGQMGPVTSHVEVKLNDPYSLLSVIDTKISQESLKTTNIKNNIDNVITNQLSIEDSLESIDLSISQLPESNFSLSDRDKLNLIYTDLSTIGTYQFGLTQEEHDKLLGLDQSTNIDISAIWSYPNRSITSGVDFSLLESNRIDSLQSSIDNIPTSGFTNVDRGVLGNITSVLGNTETILTKQFGLTDAQNTQLFNTVTSTMTASDVWTYANRSINTEVQIDQTTIDTIQDTNSIVSGISTFTSSDRIKLNALENYDDSSIQVKLTTIENKAGLKSDERAKLFSLENYDDTNTQSLIGDMIDYQQGNWKINDLNQMEFYRLDGTLMATYDLLDQNGNPASESVFRRERV